MLRHQLNLVSYSYDLASGLGLNIFLRNILAFIVEKPVRVTGPCDTPQVDLKDFGALASLWSFSFLMFLYQLLNSLVLSFLLLNYLYRFS